MAFKPFPFPDEPRELAATLAALGYRAVAVTSLAEAVSRQWPDKVFPHVGDDAIMVEATRD